MFPKALLLPTETRVQLILRRMTLGRCCEKGGVVLMEVAGACGLVGHRLALENHAVAVSVSVESVYVREVLRM